MAEMVLILLILTAVMVPQFYCIEPGRTYGDDEQNEDTVVEVVSPTPMEEDEPIEEWMQEAILDIAFYLRRHKFHGVDVRFKRNRENEIANFHLHFPIPSLTNLHHQVRRECDESFPRCLQYLDSVAKKAILTRKSNQMSSAATTTTTKNKQANKDCLKLLEEDNNWFEIFRDPLDRFRWLTTASYYMCWHAVRQNAALKHFNESCDNFAACSGIDGTYANGDVRANDKVPYACALYSFCPDPCCSNKILKRSEDCSNTPCGSDKNICTWSTSNNINWSGLTGNQWNVSCKCTQEGTMWSSQSGLCIDIDECTDGSNECDQTENCMNLFGSYECACAPGFFKDDENEQCYKDDILWSHFQHN